MPGEAPCHRPAVERTVNDVRRVLVLTSDTGAGHRSVSNALIEAARAGETGLAVGGDDTTATPVAEAASDDDTTEEA